MGTILYGSEIAKDIRTSLKEQIDELREKGKRIPKLVVILVGDNPASLSYVTGKRNRNGKHSAAAAGGYHRRSAFGGNSQIEYGYLHRRYSGTAPAAKAYG